MPRSGSCLPLCSLLSAALRRGNALCCARFRSSGWRPTSHAHRLSSDAGQLSKRAKANQALPTFIVSPRLPTKTQWSKADHQHLSSAPLRFPPAVTTGNYVSPFHRFLQINLSSFLSSEARFRFPGQRSHGSRTKVAGLINLLKSPQAIEISIIKSARDILT